jgi:hypothetical protein
MAMPYRLDPSGYGAPLAFAAPMVWRRFALDPSLAFVGLG